MDKDFQRKIAGINESEGFSPLGELKKAKGVSDIFRLGAGVTLFDYKGKEYVMINISRDELYICKKLDFLNIEDFVNGKSGDFNMGDYIDDVVSGRVNN